MFVLQDLAELWRNKILFLYDYCFSIPIEHSIVYWEVHHIHCSLPRSLPVSVYSSPASNIGSSKFDKINLKKNKLQIMFILIIADNTMMNLIRRITFNYVWK